MSRTPQRRRRSRSSRRPILWLAPGTPRRIRAGRVLHAQARIASGHYDRPEVRSRLVDAILSALVHH